MTENETRLKRLRIRAWRRGMREMDMLLGPYADAWLGKLDAAGLDGFEALLEQNDQQVFAWFCGAEAIDPAHREAVARIARHHDITLG